MQGAAPVHGDNATGLPAARSTKRTLTPMPDQHTATAVTAAAVVATILIARAVVFEGRGAGPVRCGTRGPSPAWIHTAV